MGFSKLYWDITQQYHEKFAEWKVSVFADQNNSDYVHFLRSSLFAFYFSSGKCRSWSFTVKSSDWFIILM